MGVDIFFVISGFLMTGIIARALQGGASAAPLDFLWNFLLARAKRIWPALIVMCVALLVTGWFTMSAEEFYVFAEQARSAVLFFSNIKFRRAEGYFNANAHGIWLLHTWSLSVEWQFYILLPLAMLLTWKIWPSPRALLLVLLVGALVSLGLCLHTAASEPGAAFFLMHLRAWEMLAGGIVALTAARPPRSAARGLELGGLALISYAILTFGHMAWPSWRALVPVLGTVMVLLAARHNSLPTNWVPVRWIGQRSYSIYLWHWPLAVGLYHFGDKHNPTQIACCLALTLALGHLSYVLVETRMRRPLDSLPRGAGSAVLAAACVAIVLTAKLITLMGGLPARLPADARQMFLAVRDQEEVAFRDCRILEHGNDQGCAAGGSKLGVIVLGDSHAAALFTAVKSALPDPDTHAVRWAMFACPSLLNAHSDADPSFRCARFMAWVMRRIASVPSSVPVLIINRSSLYTEGPNEEDDEDISVPHLYFSKRHTSRSPEFYREVRQNMIDTACAIAKHRKVYMMRPIPEMRVDVPNVLGHAIMLGQARQISMPVSEYTKRHAQAWAGQDAARDRCGVTILDPLPYLCTADRCVSVVNKRPMYFDDDHLSLYGASLLTPMFSTMFGPPRPGAAGSVPL